MQRALLLIATLAVVACRDATTAPAETSTRIMGRVYAADGGTLTGLQFRVRTQGQLFTAPIENNGAFELNALFPANLRDSVDLIIDATAPNARRYRPVDARVPPWNIFGPASRPLLVPRDVSFSSPTFGASTATVSLMQAFTRVCQDDANANCSSFFPRFWKTSTVPALWPDAELPIPLAFNHSASTARISAADSIVFWNVVRQLEADLGTSLFKPAMASSLPLPSANGFARGGVLVHVDSTLIAQGFGGWANFVWDGSASQNLIAGKLRLSTLSRFGNRSLVSHELLHTLGFEHTCAWSTVMGGYGCTSAAGPTRADVAAFNLSYQVRRATLSNAATTTLGDALRGEQLIENAVLASRIDTGQPVVFAQPDRRTIMLDGRTAFVVGTP
jgi:hypothetical protein